MSFQPVVTLTEVPRNNSSFTLTDNTPTGGTSGWGSINAPSAPSAITSVFAQVQPYGSIPTNAIGFSGSVSTTLVFSSSVNDGVNNFNVFYGLSRTFTDYTVSADGTFITSNDPNISNLMDGVFAISLDGITFPTIVTSISGSKINLAGIVTQGQTGTILYVYWLGTVQALTVNNGESLIVNSISLVPVEADSCVNSQAILDNIILKLGAEIAFGCGFISKAHEAALLLSGNKPIVTNNCPSCQ